MVYAQLMSLKSRGYHIWYDEGISPGHDWPEELAAAIEGCALFLLFVTPQSALSENCIRETTFAITRGRPFLAVHLEATQLPRGLELSIGNRQAILKYAANEDAYADKLQKALIDKMGLDAASNHAPVDTAAEVIPTRNRLVLIGVAATIVIVATVFYLMRESQHEETEMELARLRHMLEDHDTNIGVNSASTLEEFLLARKLETDGAAPEALARSGTRSPYQAAPTLRPDRFRSRSRPRWMTRSRPA